VTPYYSDDWVTLYHARWEEVPLPKAAAVVSDPPYGMAWDVDTTRFSGGAQGVKRGKAWDRPIENDDKPFDPAPWLGYPEVILFGSNHYGQRLPRGTTLVWVKRNDEAFGSFLSDAEVAWMKGGYGVYCYRSLRGPGTNDHPTQKPVDLMRWCIDKTTAATILDPYAGSGTTLVAAKSLGRKAIGVECVERYCEVAANRLRQEVLGLVA
jgi:site-specific DNA-methyltransferase (adenine-specific)